MTSKKNTLTLDLKDRHNDCNALIHATGDQLAGTHWAVAEVVVRMDGDKEDTPDLVNFAHELVNRYNQHDEIVQQRDELLALVDEFAGAMQDCGDWPDTTSSQENIARVAGKARKLINELEGGAV